MKSLKITRDLYLKMLQICKKNHPIEVQWLGEGSYDEEGNYVLKDIHVPPQSQSSVHVNTENIASYPKWLFEVNKKVRENNNIIRLHAHTHPMFSTYPSGTDERNMDDLRMTTDDKWIQLIYNKSHYYACVWYHPSERKEKEQIKLEVV